MSGVKCKYTKLKNYALGLSGLPWNEKYQFVGLLQEWQRDTLHEYIDQTHTKGLSG